MNAFNRLSHLPDSARIWIYVADRRLSAHESSRLLEYLDSFCANWQSHGRQVSSAAALFEDRFAVVAGVIPGGDISGCGIDASVHALERAADELNVGWMSGLMVHFRDGNGNVRSVSRPEFRRLVQIGELGSGTIVFDLSILTLGTLRAGKLEQPAGSTWHARVFRLSGTAA